MISAIDLFEELRFVISLIVAELLFILPYTHWRIKEHFKPLAGFSFFILYSLGYFWLINSDKIQNHLSLVVMGWYMAMVFFSIIYIYRFFKISLTEAIYFSISAYALQHLVYVIINEIISKGLFTILRQHLLIYALLYTLASVVIYYGAYRIFSPKLKKVEQHFFEQKWYSTAIMIFLLTLFLFNTFSNQHIFEFGDDVIKYNGALGDLFSSLIVLVVFYASFKVFELNLERQTIEHLLNMRQKQYQISKENIDLINRKCHDLKYQISALKQVDDHERESYISEVERSIMIYDAVVKTEHEVLNTILTEKYLLCEEYGIRFNCMVDTSSLDFIKTTDLYALLGNALDNAIEAVMHNEVEANRVVSLTIKNERHFLCIQVTNYLSDALQYKDGEILTAKANKMDHGYGIKSMRHLVKKYHGDMHIDTSDHIFTLLVMIPNPEIKQMHRKK